MAPKPKKNRDDFEVPNKHRIKVEKRDRKQDLRSVSLFKHRKVESPNTSSSPLKTPMKTSTIRKCTNPNYLGSTKVPNGGRKFTKDFSENSPRKR